ncbi:MAG: hypothetical protein WBD45_19605 [Terriglobales bacterium]
MALDVIGAIEEDRLRNVVVVGFEATADTLRAVKAGTLSGTAQRNPA